MVEVHDLGNFRLLVTQGVSKLVNASPYPAGSIADDDPLFGLLGLYRAENAGQKLKGFIRITQGRIVVAESTLLLFAALIVDLVDSDNLGLSPGRMVAAPATGPLAAS